MVALADLTRAGFINGDISTVMSPRTVITWAENARIFGDVGFAFRMTFLNKCDEAERATVAEYYQRCFNEEIPTGGCRTPAPGSQAERHRMSGEPARTTPAPRSSSAPPPARCAPSPSSPTCRSRSSPARPGCRRQARAPAAADARAAGRPRWRKLRGAADSARAAAAPPRRRRARRAHAGAARGADAYDALEQARVEVVGARHMAGVAANLRAKLTEECEAEGYDRMTRKDQLPIAAALALLARERMSGEASPRAGAARARHVARHAGRARPTRRWPKWRGAQDDQDAFARAARKLLAALDLAEAEAEAEPDDSNDEGEDGGEQSGQQDNAQEGEGQSASPRPKRCSARSPRRWRARRPTTTAPTSPRTTPRRPRATTGPAARSRGANAPNAGRRQRSIAPTRGCSTRRSTAEDLCDADELTRLRQQLDQQLQHLQGVISQAREPAAAPAAGAADARLGVRPGGRACWMPGGCRAWSSTRCRRCPTSASATPSSATPCVTLLIDNSGIDARPADHGGGDVRRHPGAHAGTLRGEGRGAGLHHARLEGRAEPRALGAGRQAAQSRAG